MEVEGQTKTKSEQKPFKALTSPVLSTSPEDSPLRRALEQPPLKRLKVGRTQDAGTITEPDSLGPCQPGTAINLDGIVWNETKGGLLSLNITWRGKSFMGTLMDCSTTEHGSEWTAPWVGDSEAPDQKPKVSRNKKKKKNTEESTNDPDISLENIELEDNKDEEDPVMMTEVPVQLIDCNSTNCGKKFASESALKYHVSFAHEKLAPQRKEVARSEDCNKTPSLSLKVEAQVQLSSPECINVKVSDLGANMNSSPTNSSVNCEEKNSGTMVKKSESEKQKSKPFPSTLNIRPIVPVQAPQVAGSSLKPIQPKPTILPAPTINLSLDSLKKSPKQMEKSPKNIAAELFPKGNPKYQNIHKDDDEPVVIDLSTNKDSHKAPNNPPATQTLNLKQKSPSINLYANTKQIQRETGLNINAQQQKETKKQEAVKDSVLLKIPNPAHGSKEKSPSIFVKTEFNTGHSKNLTDPTDQPEILKHTKSGANVPISSKPIKPAIFPNPLSYLPHSYFSSPQAGPGLMMPPSSTNPLMLPGLMNIPPPAAPSSPFGSSLESLARAAEERARNFGSYSPAHIPAAFSPAHAPTAFSPAHAPAAFSPAHVPAAFNPALAPTTAASSDSSDTPLLRHEHMHTHLHYITSPTHSQ